MHEPPLDPADDNLALQAFLFVSDELEDSQAEAFLRRLAEEQAAREALSQAVYAAGCLAGRTPAQPNPAYRAGVRQRLTAATPPVIAGGRRAYRGHPLLWAGLGAAAMYVVSAGSWSWSPPRMDVPSPPPVILAEHPTAPRPAPAAPVEEWIPAAEVWAVLHTPDRLARVNDEEERRRSRAEELQRLLSHDERRYQH
jgi:hypothetical protein